MLWEEEHQNDVLVLSKVENALSKFWYKSFLILIKYTPAVVIITEIISSILAYLEIDYYWVGCISYVSIMNMLYLYIASYVFRFCYLYRWCLHFIVIVNIFIVYDTYVGIPITDLSILRTHLILLGISLLFFIKFKIKDVKHNKVRS